MTLEVIVEPPAADFSDSGSGTDEETDDDDTE